MDLFQELTSPSSDIARKHAPLAVRMRPQSLDDVVGQDHILGPGTPLRRLLNPPQANALPPSSVILWGPPGTGKTTLAYLVATTSGRTFVELSAVSAGVKDVRQVVDHARTHLIRGKETVLFIDEVHRFSKTQQDALLPAVENRWVTLIAATTENPHFAIINPLLSRSILLTLEPLSTQALNQLITRALDSEQGLAGKVGIDEQARDQLLRLGGSDGRKTLTVLEASAAVAIDRQSDVIMVEDVEAAIDAAAIRYDRDGDQHYDVISAFIKSMRGSDVDGALHYLARMILAGEDPRFIARRIMIAASEEVGLADPTALTAAVNAAQAVAMIGMPEARIILAQAVIHVASAPKSNAAYRAVDAAIADVREGKAGQIPMHLRDAHYQGSAALGHGNEYKYAHDYPHAVAPQQYLPDTLAGARYYEPTDRGYERTLAERLAKVETLRRGEIQ